MPNLYLLPQKMIQTPLRTGDVSTPQMSRIAPQQLCLLSAKGPVTSGRSQKKIETQLGFDGYLVPDEPATIRQPLGPTVTVIWWYGDMIWHNMMWYLLGGLEHFFWFPYVSYTYIYIYSYNIIYIYTYVYIGWYDVTSLQRILGIFPLLKFEQPLGLGVSTGTCFNYGNPLPSPHVIVVN